jgi:glycosyltransferase involved in cell wall biosynthesis
MRKILFVLPSLEYNGAATQVSLLAAGLPRKHFAIHVCALGKTGPAAGILRSAGVPVDDLGGTRLVNLAAVWQLRRLLRAVQPDVIHTWGPRALRMVAFVTRNGRCQVLASVPFAPQDKRICLGHLNRWLVHRVQRLVAFGSAAADRYRLLGIPGEKICIIPPGVETGGNYGLPKGDCQSKSTDHRWVVCAGPIEPHKGFRDAVWAFDVLQFLYDDVRLLVVGSGSYQARLERFAAATGAGLRVQFCGPVPDLGDVLANAEVVWVPSLAESGINVALEAMAQGRAVVASRLAGLAEIIADGETGLLAAPGNKVDLARQTRVLLDEPDRRHALGEAARRRVAEHFSAADLVQRYADLYLEKRAA